MLPRTVALLLVLAALVGCDVQRGAEVAEPKPAEEGERSGSAPPPPPPARRMLPGEPAPPAALAVDALERIDLGAGLTTGEITIEANEVNVQQGAPSLFDGNLETLVKSDAVNPVEITITLSQPIRLRSARVYLAASSYDWLLEPLPGGARLLASNVPERAWSQIDLPEPVETTVVRVEALRLERDDYVHVNEIELYAEPSS